MSYERPASNAVAFTLAGYTAPAGNGIDARFEAGSYTAPGGSSITAQFGAQYTRPAAGAVLFQFQAAAFTGTGAATIDYNAAGQGAHGVAGTGAADLGIDAAGAGTFTDQAVEGTGAVTIDIEAAGEAAHGVSGTLAITLDDPVVMAEAGHGVAGFEESEFGFAVGGQGAVGVAGSGTITIDAGTAAGVGVHERYELRGEVRDQAVLVNRRVRAYNRTTGALVAEADTVAGVFALAVGFAQAEYYVVPIDLDPLATDWTPPVANRVLAVLAQD